MTEAGRRFLSQTKLCNTNVVRSREHLSNRCMRRSRSAAAVVYRPTELLQSGPQERAPETELIPHGIFGIPLRFRVEILRGRFAIRALIDCKCHWQQAVSTHSRCLNEYVCRSQLSKLGRVMYDFLLELERMSSPN